MDKILLRKNSFEESIHAYWHVLRVCLRELAGRKYEPEVYFMDRFLPDNASVIQIGASDGRHAFYLSRKLGCRHLICFEPSPYTFRILNILKRILRVGFIQTENMAVAAEAGECYLVTPVKRSGHLGLAFAYISNDPPDPDDTDTARGFIGHIIRPVPVTSLDSYFVKPIHESLDFIRCDVEGAEIEVLKGARNVMQRFRPVLLMEVHPYLLRDNFLSSADEVWSLLEDLEYSVFYLEEGQLVRASKFIEERWRDYFCVPVEKLDRFGL